MFFVLEGARWEAVRPVGKRADIGKEVDGTLTIIEAENPRLTCTMDKRFALHLRRPYVRSLFLQTDRN